MIFFLNFLSFAMGIFLTIAIVYLFFWVFVSFFKATIIPCDISGVINKFAFIVPAHNEQNNISETIRSLQCVDYPESMFDVVVVADNCVDATARVSRELGATVLERQNLSERGKGFALKFAFQKCIPKGYDAFVVIDADAIVDRNFLSVMNSYLTSGHRVIQALNGISNPEATPLTYLFHVGNILENHLFYEGKNKLGFPSILRGNGMCFSRGVLIDYSWDAFSVAEDTEYTIKLIRAGINIPFAAETRALAHQPENLGQAHSQRVRWASGNMKISKGFASKLILEGLKRRRFFLADTGISLLVLSKPLLLLVTLIMLALTFFNDFFFQSGQAILFWSLALLSAQIVYLCLGIIVGGIDSRKMKFLLKTPLYVAWMLFVIILGVVGYKADSWVRTKRS